MKKMVIDWRFIIFIVGALLFITVWFFYNKCSIEIEITKNKRALERASRSGADETECNKHKEIIRKCEDKLTGELDCLKVATAFLMLYAFISLCRFAIPATSNHTIEETKSAINYQNNMPCEVSDIYYNIWNDLIDDPLQFYIWKEQDDIKDNEQLELNYNNTIAGNSNTAFPINLSTINEYISVLRNLGYLPQSGKSLTEIDNEIRTLKNSANNVPPELYLEELSVRIERCQATPSCRNYYQAGRASSDVFSLISQGNKCSYQELIVYGSLAVCFFRMALASPEEEFDQLKNENIIITRSFLYNQIGKICLGLHEEMYAKRYEGTEFYQKHFLFLADAYFEKGINEGNDVLPIDIEANRALSEYKKIKRYGFDSLKDECLIHANNALIILNHVENNKHVEECHYIINALGCSNYDSIDCINVSSNTVSD